MKIINETRYKTEDLRLFLLVGLRAMGTNGAGKTIRVTYVRSKSESYITGHARYGRRRFVGQGEYGPQYKIVDGHTATMRLPRPPVPIDMREFARVWEHEILHLRGAKHRDMTTAQRECSGPMPAWAERLKVDLELAEPAPDPSYEDRAAARATRTADLVAHREARARKALAQWERKAATATKHVKKWRDKVRGYERRAAAKTRGP